MLFLTSGKSRTGAVFNWLSITVLYNKKPQVRPLCVLGLVRGPTCHAGLAEAVWTGTLCSLLSLETHLDCAQSQLQTAATAGFDDTLTM